MIFYFSETHIQIHENEIEHSFHNRIFVEGIEDREKSFFELNFDNGICFYLFFVKKINFKLKNNGKKFAVCNIARKIFT